MLQDRSAILACHSAQTCGSTKNVLPDLFVLFFAGRQPGGIRETVLREYIERNQCYDEHIYYAILFPEMQ
jgi:hypothetical protein